MKNYFNFSILILLLCFISCEQISDDPPHETKELETENSELGNDLNDFLISAGYDDPESLNIRIEDDKIFVNDEIFYYKKNLEEFLANKNNPSYLWRNVNYLSTTPGTKRIVPYRFNCTCSEYFKNLIISSFNEWNNIRNINIQFVNDVNEIYFPWISVSTFSTSTNTVIYVNQPWNSGGHGDVLVYSPSNLTNYSAPKQKWAMVKMIGNILGIREQIENVPTNKTLVAGTWASEIYTMYKYNVNGYIANEGIPDWNGFFYTDLLAIRYLWPHDNTEKPVYSYVSTYSGWQDWSLNWNQRMYGNSEYLYWGINGYIYTQPKTGTIAIYKYTHSSGTPYFSTNPSLNVLYPSYTSNGIFGHGFSSPGPGRIPIYEYYNPSVGYFFVTQFNDPHIQGPGWIGGGIAFYTLSLI